MRMCSESTKREIAQIELPKPCPTWLKAAVSNALRGYPMSLTREDRMCRALGIPSPKRPPRRFYRPCLSLELGEAIRESGVDVEAIILEYMERHELL